MSQIRWYTIQGVCYLSQIDKKHAGIISDGLKPVAVCGFKAKLPFVGGSTLRALNLRHATASHGRLVVVGLFLSAPYATACTFTLCCDGSLGLAELVPRG